MRPYFFFFNDTATTEIYTLSLHDALPIYARHIHQYLSFGPSHPCSHPHADRSEEHTSELQSQSNLVCRLLLEKKKILGGARPCSPQLLRQFALPLVKHIDRNVMRFAHQLD